MAEREKDPIRIEYPQAPFDERLAKFAVRTENSPREQQNSSVPLYAWVAFGTRRYVFEERGYTIAINTALLEATPEGCSFGNTSVFAKLDASPDKDRPKTRRAKAKAFRIGFKAGAKLNPIGPFGGANLSANIDYNDASKQQTDGKEPVPPAQAGWEPGGIAFDAGRGGAGKDSGPLKGVIIDGKICDVFPDRGAASYGVTFRLVAPMHTLSVKPETHHLLDHVPGSMAEARANVLFDLKAAVANWVMKQGLATEAAPDGHDESSGEILLAACQVRVDLDAWTGPAVKALPPPDKTREVPVISKPGKTTRKPKT